MDRDKAIEKIRKCLALGMSSQPHEAAAAMRQAQALMSKFDVDAHDVMSASFNQALAVLPSGQLALWQSQLAGLVADTFGCGRIWSRELWRRDDLSFKTLRQVTFYGPGTSPEIAKYCFDVLLRQLIRSRAAHIRIQPRSCKQVTKTARGELFSIGWVHGVRRLVTSFSGGQAHEDLLLAYASKTWPDSVAVKPSMKYLGRNVRPGDYQDGVKVGSAAELNRGVEGATARPMLTGASGA